ncbi:MAG: hypothetical protein Q9202_004370 [Teloschistes flavicans]
MTDRISRLNPRANEFVPASSNPSSRRLGPPSSSSSSQNALPPLPPAEQRREPQPPLGRHNPHEFPTPFYAQQEEIIICEALIAATSDSSWDMLVEEDLLAHPREELIEWVEIWAKAAEQASTDWDREEAVEKWRFYTRLVLMKCRREVEEMDRRVRALREDGGIDRWG